jgi:hypothetical protein
MFILIPAQEQTMSGPRKRFNSRKLVQLTDELDRAVEAVADAENLSDAAVIRRALAVYFRLHPQEVQATV